MSERPGTLIGTSNVVTAASSRVAPGPDPDRTAGLRDRLRTNAMRALEGRESFIQDAIVAGRRVRLFSNSHHLADFWKDNWPGEADWQAARGGPLPKEPALTVHAMIGVAAEAPASYVSASRGEAYLFNTSYYADLRATALEGLNRQLGPDAQLLHGAAVEVSGRTLVLLYPKEIVHPTPAWGLLESPGSRLLADGWLLRDAADRLQAVEKQLYARVSFVETYPEYAARLVRCKFENVPDATPAAADQKAAAAQAVLEAALRHDPRGHLRALPPDRQREFALRLVLSRDARAMIDPVALLGKPRVTPGPAAPAAAFALKADGGEAFRQVSLERFACPCYEVRPGAIAGSPRDVARQIASR